MATVQITFTDDSNNEDSFSIYRSGDGSNGVAVSDDAKIATLSWSGSAWTIANGSISSDSSIESGSATNDPSNRSQQFIVRYTENASGSYKYGVVATNAIGNSDITITNDTVVV